MTRLNRRAGFWLLPCCAWLAACALVPSERSSVLAGCPPFHDAGFRWSGAVLEVTGEGRPDPSMGLPIQRRSASRDAAILDARARLEAYLGRCPATGGKRSEKPPQIKIGSVAWSEDDDARVVIRVTREALQEALDSH